MWTRGSFAILAIILTTGCAQTVKLRPSTDAESLWVLNDRLTDAKATVYGTSAILHKGGGTSSLRVESDSTSWLDSDTGTCAAIPTDWIDKIVIRNASQSPGEGTGAIMVVTFSAGIGAGLGCLVTWEPPESNGACCGPRFGECSGLAIGALSGFLIGALRMATAPDWIYRFDQSPRKEVEISVRPMVYSNGLKGATIRFSF